jgi:hypothetical protein
MSMDGVVQVPDRPDEDTRDGFDRGEWAVPCNDEAIERFAELIHPLVLGQGHRLFDERGPGTDFELVDSLATSTGVIIASYQER